MPHALKSDFAEQRRVVEVAAHQGKQRCHLRRKKTVRGSSRGGSDEVAEGRHRSGGAVEKLHVVYQRVRPRVLLLLLLLMLLLLLLLVLVVAKKVEGLLRLLELELRRDRRVCIRMVLRGQG